MFDRDLDQLAVFLDIDGRRFARRADDDDAGGAAGDVKVEKLGKPAQIERAAGLHRRDDCDQASLQHRLEPEKCGILP